MQKEYKEEGLLHQVQNQRLEDQGVEVLLRGTGTLMIVEIGSIVGGVLYVPGMSGMNIETRIEITVVEVQASASVLDMKGVAVDLLDVLEVAVQAY